MSVDDEYHDEDGLDFLVIMTMVKMMMSTKHLFGEVAREQERLFVSEQADHWSSNLAS